MFKRKKIGLALGGGGARGMAHIGILKILEQYKIPIDMIAGTSIGAVIGALYSAEPNAKKLEKEAVESDWKGLFDYGISKSGIIKGDRIEKFLEQKLSKIDFKDLKIPLYITSFDIKKKREAVFSKGDVIKAVRASISIPGIFIPVESKGEVFVDGGITDIIPIDALREAKADIIIAVNVETIKQNKTVYGQKACSTKSEKSLPNVFNILARSSQVISAKASALELEKEKADLIISPNLEGIDLLDFSKAKKAIKIGEKAARSSIEEIKNLAKPNIFKDFLANLDKNLGLKSAIKEINFEDSIKKQGIKDINNVIKKVKNL